MKKTIVDERLLEHEKHKKHWKRWGPYLSERQWGTVREDYSEDGDAWKYFPFENAHWRVYRWGEDGIGGISDNHQRICFAWAFWNEQDDILKERLFGLTGSQGNHGEDLKEYYFYLDNTPAHAYMKCLYKYPQKKFPYEDLRKVNQSRSKTEPEYELLDTKVFDEDRYFDCLMEYAKADPDDILIRITISNRGPDAATIHVLPTLWFRNTWSWTNEEPKFSITEEKDCLKVEHPEFKTKYLYYLDQPTCLFTENDTNTEKQMGQPCKRGYAKDAFHEWVIHKQEKAVNPKKHGTKSALHYELSIPSKQSMTLEFRFTEKKNFKDWHKTYAAIFKKRLHEADKFYTQLIEKTECDDLKNIQRQAFAGLLWSKQWYHYVVEKWLEGDDPKNPPPKSRYEGRNATWTHIYNDDVLSMPDKWEYPWFAAWDMAFHAITLSYVDADFAKKQLMKLVREWYMHPNGHIPSYEWNFSDVNPPVHVWAAWRVYKIAQRKHHDEDKEFLSSIFQKLLLNFTWWVNRKDSDGKNIFQGGFLGLDNISVFDRSAKLPDGSSLSQADATSWMGMYCLNMWTVAMELAPHASSYEDMASKFFEHFLYIAEAINYSQKRGYTLWDEEDGFYYDVLHKKDGSHTPIRVHSIAGLIPLFAVATLEEKQLDRLKDFTRRFNWFLDNRRDLCEEIANMQMQGKEGRRILAIVDRSRLEKILKRLLSEDEFLSPYGIRSVSKFHQGNPYRFDDHKVDYEPAESTTGLFGGNSNWRGPIWFPLNFLLIESLQKFHHYYGDTLKVECPTGSGKYMNLWEVASEISCRLIHIFQKDEKGYRPIYGSIEKFQKDPEWKNYILFNEYFHADTGFGLGACHQTGWTALIAKLILQQSENK